MARIRTIKPDFWTDERITECSVSARLLFIGMLNFADDNGNLPASPKKIKMQVFPADSFDCQPLIDELITHGVLIEYSVSGDKYWNIKGFKKHQKINRPSQTAIPEPESADGSVRAQGGLTDGKETEKEGKGKEGNKEKTNKKEIPDTGDPADTAVVSLASPVPDSDPEPDKPPSPVSQHGAIATYVRSQGIHAVSTDQELLNLVKAGATMAHFVDAVPVAKDRGKGWKYLLGIVKNMLQDAQAPPPTPTTRHRKEPYDPRSYFEKDKPNDDNIIDAHFTVVGEK